MSGMEPARKCVAFVGAKKDDGTFITCGTGFFVIKNLPDEPGRGLAWLVTAKHVLDGIKNKLGLDTAYVRVNLIDGDSVWMSAGPIHEWMTSTDPTVDVALIPTRLRDEFDHMGIGEEAALTDELKEKFGIGAGEPVIITGLFRHHEGSKQNIPIVRSGNLAVMDEEKISTRLGMMDAYLIEARSIGGLSGSPVFVNCGTIRRIDGQMKVTDRPILIWMGLIHGHFDTDSTKVDDVIEDSLNPEKVNVGIAIVVPVEKILEMINTHFNENYNKKTA